MYNIMVIPGIKGGVCGCVYTQVSDVEDENSDLYVVNKIVDGAEVGRNFYTYGGITAMGKSDGKWWWSRSYGGYPFGGLVCWSR